MSNLIEIKNLSISFGTPSGCVNAVNNVSLDIKKGEIYALVGESGSGKSVLCKSIMGLLPEKAEITGQIFSEEKELLSLPKKELRSLRGTLFSMVFQDPMTALNPTLSIGRQIAEAILVHTPNMTKNALWQRVYELMEMVGIEDSEERSKMFPHSFSGGMRQRAVLAIALASNSKLIIADEPTSSLDVTIQAQILELLSDIRKRLGTTILLVSHDMGVVARLADRIGVLGNGKLVETGTAEEVFYNPKHEYTKKLLNALPKHSAATHNTSDKNTPKTDILLDIKNLNHSFKINNHYYINAISNFSLQIKKGEIFGLVGESGSGKSTVARCLMNVYTPLSGIALLNGINIFDKKSFKKNKVYLQTKRQMVFQDSASSLDPKMKLLDVITEPLAINKITTSRESYRAEALFQLHYVGMDGTYLERYPTELSGGQRQRAAIARALTMEPELLIADEPLASLDVSTQAQIVKLFKHLQYEHGFTFLFIAHDMAMVRSICDRVGVMYQGHLVEVAPTEELFENPQHSYTQVLLSAIPLPDPSAEKVRKSPQIYKSAIKNGKLEQISAEHFVYKEV